MMIPLDARFPMLKHVLTFDGMQPLGNVVRDLRLQFAGESAQGMHLWALKESHVLQFLDVVRECVKVLIDTGKRLISFQFSSKMVPSQFAPPSAGWSEARPMCKHWRVSLRFSHTGRAKARQKLRVVKNKFIGQANIFIPDLIRVHRH